MKTSTLLVLTTISIFLQFTVSAQENQEYESNWPQWRGPLGNGVALNSDPPDTWSETENIRWKIKIPGNAFGTPVIWGKHVFVSTAIQAGNSNVSDGLLQRLTRRIVGTEGATNANRYVALALDRHDGSIIWENTLREAIPHEGKHQTGSWASASAVTDGQVVCTFFGSIGLYCLNMNGEQLWSYDFGDMEIRMGFGEGASPALYGDTIVITWDHQGESFITALDKYTGRELWRSERDEITSWSTPVIVEHNGINQVITSATNRVRSYDLRDGTLLWDGDGVTLNAIPTPVSEEGIVYLTSGYRGDTLYAVDLDNASGDITDSESIIWSLDRDTPYVPSPVLYKGILYFTKGNEGILSAFNSKTGQPYYGPQRLPGIRSIYASPVAANDRLYITSRDGTTAVISAGPSFEVLSANILDDNFDASPAIAGGELYLRGHQYLYCIAND